MPDQGPGGEGLIHYVTQELLPEQPPFPLGYHTLELSWSRTKAVMRIRLSQCEHEWCQAMVDDDGVPYEWHLVEMNGPLNNTTTDAKTGRMTFYGKCLIIHNGGRPKAQFWSPK